MKLRYTPNPASGLSPIEIPATGTPYELIRDSLYGFGGLAVQHFVSQAPTQNGATYFASRYEPRNIMFSFRISARGFDEVQALKRQVSRSFSASFGEGTLRIYTDVQDTVWYDIVCVPSGTGEMFRVLSGASDKHCICTVALTAYSPFWSDAGQANTITFGTTSGGFTLPFSFPFSLGEPGIGGAENRGSVPTPVIISIEGAGTNPIITNQRTGEYISIDYPAQQGDTITVNTDEAITSVIHTAADGTQTDIFSAVELGSVFFQLLPGLNEISVVDSGADVPQVVTVSWQNLYLGVF